MCFAPFGNRCDEQFKYASSVMATNLITKCKEEKEYAQFSTRARPNHFLKEEKKKTKEKMKKNLSDEGKK